MMEAGMIALLFGAVCLTTVTIVTDAALVRPNPDPKIKSIFEKTHVDSDKVSQVKKSSSEPSSGDPGQPTEWFECGQTIAAQDFETAQSNEHFTISTTKMTALEGYNYCADLVQYPEISDPGILYTNTEAIDFCMFETLKEFSSLRSTDPAGTPVYPMVHGSKKRKMRIFRVKIIL